MPCRQPVYMTLYDYTVLTQLLFSESLPTSATCKNSKAAAQDQHGRATRRQWQSCNVMLIFSDVPTLPVLKASFEDASECDYMVMTMMGMMMMMMMTTR